MDTELELGVDGVDFDIGLRMMHLKIVNKVTPPKWPTKHGADSIVGKFGIEIGKFDQR